MSKSNRYQKKDHDDDDQREERLLTQIAEAKAPGVDEKRLRKGRKSEKSRLRKMTKEFNNV